MAAPGNSQSQSHSKGNEGNFVLRKRALDSLANAALTIVVFGASGHLARTKIYPSLYELFSLGVFHPRLLKIVGFARSSLTRQQFLDRVGEGLPSDDPQLVARFLDHCTYFKGSGYEDERSHEELAKALSFLEAQVVAVERRLRKEESKRQEKENLAPRLSPVSSGDEELSTSASQSPSPEPEGVGEEEEHCQFSLNTNRLFYLATPPQCFGPLAAMIDKHLSVPKGKGWTRVVVEKPFGRDLRTCEELLRDMGQHLSERQVYRIDHYLAKEMVQNMLVFRFSNTIWDTIWDRRSIKCIKISLKEDMTVEGRGGYYDKYGVVRDVFQNHLLQVLTLLAMEAPSALTDAAVRNEKVKVLKAIQPPEAEHVVVGQYEGYAQDESVLKANAHSKQITFVQMVLFVRNRRWSGVPFICKAGKAIDRRCVTVKIQFQNSSLCLFPNAKSNELVIRLQPNPAIDLHLNTKKPGFAPITFPFENSLDVQYPERFSSLNLPKAYTRLLLDAVLGDQSLFVRDDELRAAWSVVDPVVRSVEAREEAPELYKIGSRGPPAADAMAARFGWNRDPETDHSDEGLPNASSGGMKHVIA